MSSYTTVLCDSFRSSPGPVQEFAYVWTSEEDQHSMLLETCLLITDNGDHAKRSGLRKSILADGGLISWLAHSNW